ncbi:MAG: AAA family ATPase [Candidatus Woesearchaeota archaeon]
MDTTYIMDMAKKYNKSPEEVIFAMHQVGQEADTKLHEILGKDTVVGKPGVEFKFKKKPKEIKEYLDRYVIGQEDLKKRLSIAVAYHYKSMDYIESCRKNGEDPVKIRKKNTMIYGPTGCGKSYSVEKIAEKLDVPLLIADATDFTEAGYVGKDVDSMVRELVNIAPGKDQKEKVTRAKRGIIFIDEMDKKAKTKGTTGVDVSREGFQRAVLKLVENKDVPLENPNKPSISLGNIFGGPGGQPQETTINTEGILFISGGSFQRREDSLEAIIRNRKKKGGSHLDGRANIGFARGSEQMEKDPKEMDALLSEAVPEDFYEFGILPELVGRFPVHSHVNRLTKHDLVRIMNETEDSILKQYEVEFGFYGINIKFEKEAVEAVAEMATKMTTGARALVTIWERIFTEYQFELPSSSVKEFSVTSEMVSKPGDYLFELLKKSPFEEYSNYFRREFGVNLEFSDDSISYITGEAKKNEKDISFTCKALLDNIGYALRLSGINNNFKLEKHMLKDPSYFENMVKESRAGKE